MQKKAVFLLKTAFYWKRYRVLIGKRLGGADSQGVQINLRVNRNKKYTRARVSPSSR